MRSHQPVALLSDDEIKVALDAFSDWSVGYLAASPEQRATLEVEGVRLATQRRVAVKQLIQKDPRKAIESATPRVVRQDLPESVTKLLEKPVSAKGNLEVLWGKVAPGITPPKQPLVLRSFEVGDTRYAAHVYGELASVTSRSGIPLRGVAVDSELAIAENAVRPLEVGERIPAGVKVTNTCPVSKKTTIEIAEGQAVTDETPTVEIAEQIITLCSTFHTQFLEESFRNYIQGSGSGGGGFFIDNYPGTASKAIGNLRCLYIRVTYPDQMQQPISEELAYSDMRDNARFYLENSYGKLTQTTSVTPTLVLPHSLRWYYDYHDQNGGGSSQVAFQQIHTDARAAAKAAGYDSANFDCILVRVNQGPQLEGISWGGGNTVWLTWNGMDVINHEVGHSLGRNHANYWDTTPPTGDGTPYGFGANAEYGNIFDNMGSGNGFAAHYNTVSKQALGWLPSSYVHTPVINGSYRVYAYDQSRLEEGKRYALNIAKDAGRTYNLEYHPAMGNYLTDAAVLIYSGLGTNCGHLIDTTQGTIPGKTDAGIPVGRTYSDPEADLHFTTLSKNGTVPESIDVMVNKGPFPGNVAPTASFTASATTITTGTSVTFTATASDTNGDTLAYFWEFDDGVTGDNTSSYARTFNTTGQFTAMLTVSDMKGGSVRRSTVINVGSHGRQTISGTITAGGVGLQGVYVSGGGKGCYTNADGTYTLSYQTGTPSLTATLAGYTFTNPLSVAAGSTTANWSATTGTLVTLAKLADTAEGGTNGTFQFTRTGSTAAALTVYVNPPSGTATLTTDYSMSPAPGTSGSYRTFTIGAGSATLNVTVTPVNDTTAEGPETISMCIAGSGTAGSYYASGNNSVAMTIADNDTALPQVSVTAPDRYAMEGPGGDNGTFRFTRTGATTSSLAVTVAWSGTAINSSDYNTLSTTVTIPVGQSFVDVSVVPINEAVIEIPETVIATISTNAAYLLNTGATNATVTMSDDDAPVVTVSALDPIATEGGADTGVFMLTRTGSTAAALTVYYGLRGVAQHGTDYAWMTGEVVIPAGAASAPVVIYAFDDDMAEPTETMILAVTTFNNSYSIGTNYEATVQIVDNADTPFIDVRAGVSGSSGVSYANQAVGTTGTEGGSNPTFIIHSVGHGSGSVTVNYTLSGTATSGSDYTALSGTVSIPVEGVNDTTITVPIINDAIAEPTETLILTLTPSPNYRFYNDGSATVSIFDNENNDRVSVSQGRLTPTEAGTAEKFAFRRTKTVGALTVNYTVSGTATNGTDYNTLNGSVTIPDTARVAEITVTPINDTAAEGTETVTVTVAPGTGYGVDLPSSATLEIVDNETPGVTVGFQSATFTTDELPGLLGQYRDLPVVLSASSANTITVNYYANGGNSLGDDVDWVFVDAADGNKIIPKGTLTFAPGVTTQNIRIKINNDGYAELNETAIIQLGGAYNAGLTATKDKQTITINDAAAPRFVRMLIPSSTRYEADGSEPMLQVILDRAAGVSPITVNYAATGTATSGSDYTLTGTSLTFNTGELIKAIPLSLLTDAVNESAETIVISLSSPSGASLTGPSTHTITLLDSSAPVVATQFVNAASSQATNTLITTATATVASGRSVSSWSLLSGNTGNAFALNSTNGQITLAIPAALPNPGGIQLIVRVTDNTGATGAGAINIICNAAANPVVEARWVGEEAYLYEDWSGIKSYTGNLATLTSAQNVGNDFSRRLTSYLKPATTGNYTFYIAGDRDCRLYLSTDGYESRKVKIAEVVGGTNSAYQGWDTYLSQKSVSIPLVAGKVYWIEAQHFDNSGNDSVSVAWEGPGITRVAIPGSVLVATAPGVSFNEPQGNGVVNTAPTISNVTDTSTGINTSTGAIAITVGDAETAVGSLILSGSSSNLTLVPNSNIVFGGSGANRTVTITPASGQSGNAVITLNVTDGVATTSDTFLLAVGSSQIVAFKLATSSGAESVTPANIQIEMLPANMSGSVSVDYAVGGGSATSGSDYTFTNGTMVFAPGETLKTVPITVVNDSLGENNETVNLVLGNAIGAVIGTNSTHTYTIVNEDTDFSIVATDAAAAEAGSATGTFTITRAGLTAAPVTVNLTIGGTATNSADYTSIPSTLSFAVGETVKTITVTPVDDVIVDGSETLSIDIAAGAGYTIGSPSSATVNIADDDVDISITATTPNTVEQGAAGVFTVTRTGITTGTTVVNLTIGGTAVPTTDYTTIAATLTFTAGQTSKTINVSPTNDSIYEGPETVTIDIAAGIGYQPAAPSGATVNIADNDKPTISVAGTITAASETGPVNGFLTFTRTGWTGPSLDVALTVTGTAASGSDYTALPATITFPAGSDTTTLTVATIDDSLFEVSETVIVTIAANVAYTVAGAPNNAATVTIADNDKPTVTVAATDAAAAEATTANPGAFTLTRTGTTAATLTATYTLSGTAINGTDYTTLTGSVTFAAGSATAAVAVTVTNDTEYEGSEDVGLTLNSDPAYLLGAGTSASVTIADNDLPVVSVSASDTTPLEGGAASVLTFTRTGITSLGPLTILYAPTGTATVGSDYAPMSGTITIPQGQATATLNADLVQDNVTEAPETLIVTITANAAYTVATAPANAANLTILDDTEAVAVNIAATDAAASEPAKGDGTGLFTITRSGSTTAALSVNIRATGTGIDSIDYSALPTTVTIPAGQISATVILTPTDDLEAEVDETVILSLLAGTGYSVGATPSATVNLYDDEAAEVRVEVSDTLCHEAATVGTGAFTLRRLGNRAAALTVNYTVSGTATSASDYTALTGTAALGANGPSVVVTVTPINDALVEGTETVILTLATGTGYAINAQNSGTLDIRDDETVDVTVAAQDPNCAEQATPDTGNFRITRSATAATPLTVNYSITGTSTNGTDYTTLSGTATIAASATFVDVLLTPTNDGVLEGTESVIMTLTPATVLSDYDLGDARAVTILIKDDESPNISVAATDAAASEGDGSPVDNGLYTFTASFASASDLTINYTVSGGTNGADYNFLPGTIVLPAGQTTVTLPLVPIDDQMPEGAETVGVALAYGANYNAPSLTAANVVIAANDTPTASIVAFDANATENSTNTGRFIVTLSKAVTGNTNVTYTVSGTATSASDYTALTGTVTVGTGASSAIITVTPLDDVLSEGPESVIVALTAAASYTLAFPSVATVTIADDEPAPGTYAVSYNANSASSGTIPTAQTKTHDVSLTLQNNTGFLARTGYTFVGWNTQPDGLGTDYPVAGDYTVNAAVILFAKWSSIFNTAPTITNIADSSTNEDTATSAIAFTVGDAETAATSLTVSGTSSNLTLVSNANIVFGGSGASRTVTVTPLANQTGTSTITVTVSDGALTATDTFVLTVNGVNDAPTISNIADSSTNEDTATSAIAFTIGDAETAATTLTVSGTSSNLSLVPNANIVFGGSGASRTVTVTPVANQSGTSTITVTVSDSVLTATDTFLLTVNTVNDAPTITNIADSSTNEDTASSAIAFTIGDVETAATSLTVSGTSSNLTLVPNANIVFGGSGASRTVTVTPAANQTGTSTITVTVSDSVLTATDTFLLTVNAVNDAPTITNITDQTTTTGVAVSNIPFTVGDVETTVASLTVSGTSSNLTLLPNANIVFGGSGASRTVTVTPAAAQTGTATVTVTVSDGTLTATDTFVLTVNSAPNTAPTITNIVDSSTNEDTASSAIAFTVGDAETAATSLTVSGTSSNLSLVPNANIVFGGSGASRTVTVTPVANQSGTSTITVTVSDSALTATDTFLLTVNTVNDAPTITNIADSSTNEDTASSAIAFTIGDVETAAASLTVSGTSSNLTLVPNANIVFGGSGANRTVTVTPVANQTGTSTITVTVSDSVLTATDTFLLTVNAVNDAPTITNIADSSTNQDTATSAIAFTIGDVETAATSLTVSGTSSNLALVPNANIVFGGSGASRTVTVTPAANQAGTSTITVTVSDSALTATDTFVLTVNAVSTVTFNANGGDAPSPATMLVTPGSAYGTLASVTRSGHSLNGWFTAASGGTQVTSATIVTIMGNHTLYAQWTQNLPEMDVTRGGTPKSSGSYDAISGTSAGTGVPLTYLITNSGTGDLTLGSPAVSGQSNCSVVINTPPSAMVAASGNTNLALTVTPTAAGAWSFNLSIVSDDSDENPYQWTVHGVAQGSATTAFPVSVDTYINGASAGTQYGSSTTLNLNVRGNQNRRGLINFDLSTIPAGSTVTAASIQFVAGGGQTGSVEIYDTLAAWDATATSTSSSGAIGSTLYGSANITTATLGTAVPSITLNAAAITTVQGWINNTVAKNGFSIKTNYTNNSANSVTVCSNDHATSSYRPKLTLTYTYTPQVSEIHVARAGSPVADAATDTISSSVVGSGTQLTYTIANLGNANLTLTTPVSVSGATNCAVQVDTQPANTVTASSSTNLVITVTPSAAGAWSANLSIANNDANENPYNWTISGNAITRMDEWKQTNFGVDWNNPAVAGDLVDYENDGVANLLEYAFGTIPTTATPASALPQSSVASGSLVITFNRVVANTDLTMTVQGADSPAGPWTDLASSVNGAATTSLVGGVTVSETGSGATKSVSVTDLYTTSDPAHPRRFMRMRVSP